MAIPRLNVSSLQPSTLPFGLLSVAADAEVNDGHWASGIEWESMLCAPDFGVTGGPCDSGTKTVKDTYTGVAGGDPVSFYVLSECRAVGGMSVAQERASLRLAGVEERAMEAHLWSLMVADVGLTDITPTPGTAVSVKVGLALLEKAIADETIGGPVIHAPRAVASLLTFDGGVKQQARHLETGLGTKVSAGVGYGNDGPTGAAPAGTAWLMASGPVVTRRGPRNVFEPQIQRDPQDNTIITLAERTVVVAYECAPQAVLVNLA